MSTKGQYASNSSIVQQIGVSNEKAAWRVSEVWGGNFSIVDASSGGITGAGLLPLLPFRGYSFRSSREVDALCLWEEGEVEGFEGGDGDLDASE